MTRGCRGEGEEERGTRKRNKRTRDRILTQSNFFLIFYFPNYCYLHCTHAFFKYNVIRTVINKFTIKAFSVYAVIMTSLGSERVIRDHVWYLCLMYWNLRTFNFSISLRVSHVHIL